MEGANSTSRIWHAVGATDCLPTSAGLARKRSALQHTGQNRLTVAGMDAAAVVVD
jgi:hypothetical protein